MFVAQIMQDKLCVSLLLLLLFLNNYIFAPNSVSFYIFLEE